ncbi:hypothetical protein C0J52_26008 [Blattella germanica]|nr:hypothetical protein C0J52_26008 [Blattella germanica]
MKCSYRWYKRWCDRFHVLLRHEGDEALLEWALTQLERGHSLTLSDLQVQALNLASHNAFKVSGIDETELPVPNVLVLQQEEGIMDAVCLEKHVPEPNFLLMDCLEAHAEQSISQEFSKRKSTRLIIPGGCTSKLQPLDVSLKNLFQAFIQKKWLMFNSRSSTEWDVGDNKLHLPGWKDIVEWVSSAYHELQATEQRLALFTTREELEGDTDIGTNCNFSKEQISEDDDTTPSDGAVQ